MVITALVIMVCVPLMAEPGLKGKMMVGPYAGYTIGFGDAFQDVEFPGFKSSFGPSYNLGGNFHYGLSDKMMIGGEIYLQNYTYKVESDLLGFGKRLGGAAAAYEASESELESSFLFSALYRLSMMQKAMLMLNFGGGLYGGSENEIGFFGGIMYQRLLAAKLAIFLASRMHFVMASETIMMLQLMVGVHFWLGSSGAPMEM